MKKGILIGADSSAEELIPWWYRHYSRNCALPIAIVDFGMTKKMRAWSQTRMTVISLQEEVSVKQRSEIAANHIKLWKKQYRGPLWQAREAWFKKPKACLLSPFDVTLWLDLDCEVCGPLDPLFDHFEEQHQLAISLQDYRFDKPIVYNSGVILFRKESPFLKEWDERCMQHNGTMMGDQDVLTSILLEGTTPFEHLSPIYNWRMYGGVQPGIVIAHWAAGWGKEYIRKHGGLFDLINRATMG